MPRSSRDPRRAAAVAAALALALLPVLAAGCGGDAGSAERRTLDVVVNAPFSETPYVGETIARGAELAAAEIRDGGGIVTDSGTFDLQIVRADTALSPQRAVANVKDAVRRDAVAVIDEGTGVDASWTVAERALLPLCIAYQGGAGLVDPATRPNVFRIAPTEPCAQHTIRFEAAQAMRMQTLRAILREHHQ